MNQTTDEKLRRLFAQQPEIAPEEAFVAGVAMAVAAQRSRLRLRRIAVAVLAAGVAVLLSVWLAPYAPVSLPDAMARAGASAAVPGRLPLYLYLVMAAGALPLAATVWLLRRSR
jgi:hypothetical protein